METATKSKPAKTQVLEKKSSVALVQQFFGYMGNKQYDQFSNVLAEDIRWTIPGHNPMAGTKVGIPEVVAFLQALNKVNYSAELVYLDGNDTTVVEVHRGKGEAGDIKFNVGAGAVFTIKGGRIVEIWNMADNQFALDDAYNRAFEYAPIPQRLKQ